MKKKEATKIFAEDILPGLRTKELWATSGSRSYKDGVYVDPKLRCDAWRIFIGKLIELGARGIVDCWGDAWRPPGCCYWSAEQWQLKYYTKAGMQ